MPSGGFAQAFGRDGITRELCDLEAELGPGGDDRGRCSCPLSGRFCSCSTRGSKRLLNDSPRHGVGSHGIDSTRSLRPTTENAPANIEFRRGNYFAPAWVCDAFGRPYGPRPRRSCPRDRGLAPDGVGAPWRRKTNQGMRDLFPSPVWNGDGRSALAHVVGVFSQHLASGHLQRTQSGDLGFRSDVGYRRSALSHTGIQSGPPIGARRRRQDRLVCATPRYWRDGCSDARARHQSPCRQAQGGPGCTHRGGARGGPLESTAGYRPRHAVVTYHPRCVDRWNAVARRLLPGMAPSRAIDLRTVDRHPLRHSRARLSVPIVSGVSADAEAAGLLRVATSQASRRRSMKTFGARPPGRGRHNTPVDALAVAGARAGSCRGVPGPYAVW